MVTSLLIAMTSPPLPPSRPIDEQVAACEMISPDGARSRLEVHFRPEEPYGRRGYRWTIRSDDARYPSDPAGVYMQEDSLSDSSGVGLVASGYQYWYRLVYELGPGPYGSVFLPAGYMIVRRRPYGNPRVANEPVGIGFCDIRRVAE